MLICDGGQDHIAVQSMAVAIQRKEKHENLIMWLTKNFIPLITLGK